MSRTINTPKGKVKVIQSGNFKLLHIPPNLTGEEFKQVLKTLKKQS